MNKANRYLHQARDFVRDYTEGFNVNDIKRLFDHDAPKAYAVLAREQGDREENLSDFRRFLHRTKVLFLGISYKLTPARRVLFALSLILALAGGCNYRFDFNAGDSQLSFETSPIWFVASIAILIFLLTVELVDRIRVRDELEVARQLQRDLLPAEPPVLPGYRFAHSYRTANEVGGDYFDYTQLPDGRLAIAIGDASGHGIAAGLLMAIANATLKTAIEIDPTPASVARLLNATLLRTGDRRAFMTLFYGVLEFDSGRLDYVCAGHPFPLLRRDSGEIEELGEGSLPLGMRADPNSPCGATELRKGDTLVLYTDGLPEAVGGTKQTSFGFNRIRALIAEPGTVTQLHDRITAAFERHVTNGTLDDDYTLIVVGRRDEGSWRNKTTPGSRYVKARQGSRSRPHPIHPMESRTTRRSTQHAPTVSEPETRASVDRHRRRAHRISGIWRRGCLER